MKPLHLELHTGKIRVSLPSNRLFVTETFVSLQGEGLHAGLPCFFIRLSGCNLRCRYCDTTYAYKPGSSQSLETLIEQWKQSQVNLVQITGGEPLIQPAVYPLMRELLQQGAKVLLETNGSMNLKQVPFQVIKVVDRKTPGSGMAGSWFPLNLKYLSFNDQVKYVLTSEEDFYWAAEEITTLEMWSISQVLFSPASNFFNPKRLAELLVTSHIPVKFQLQLHKVLWGNRAGI